MNDQQTSALAVLSLIFGGLALLMVPLGCCVSMAWTVSFVFALAGGITGLIELKNIAEGNSGQSNRTMAVTGVAMSAISLLLVGLIALFCVFGAVAYVGLIILAVVFGG